METFGTIVYSCFGIRFRERSGAVIKGRQTKRTSSEAGYKEMSGPTVGA